MPSVSAVRGNVHVLRVGFPQGYEVSAFATLLRHLANIQSLKNGQFVLLVLKANGIVAVKSATALFRSPWA